MCHDCSLLIQRFVFPHFFTTHSSLNLLRNLSSPSNSFSINSFILTVDSMWQSLKTSGSLVLSFIPSLLHGDLASGPLCPPAPIGTDGLSRCSRQLSSWECPFKSSREFPSQPSWVRSRFWISSLYASWLCSVRKDAWEIRTLCFQKCQYSTFTLHSLCWQSIGFWMKIIFHSVFKNPAVSYEVLQCLYTEEWWHFYS